MKSTKIEDMAQTTKQAKHVSTCRSKYNVPLESMLLMNGGGWFFHLVTALSYTAYCLPRIPIFPSPIILFFSSFSGPPALSGLSTALLQPLLKEGHAHAETQCTRWLSASSTQAAIVSKTRTVGVQT